MSIYRFSIKLYRKKTTGYEKTPRNLRSLIYKGFLFIFEASIPILHLRNVCPFVYTNEILQLSLF